MSWVSWLRKPKPARDPEEADLYIPMAKRQGSRIQAEGYEPYAAARNLGVAVTLATGKPASGNVAVMVVDGEHFPVKMEQVGGKYYASVEYPSAN